MDTLAYFLLIIAGLLIRGVIRGRVTDLPSDIRDTFVGVLTGNIGLVREVGTRTGTANTVPTASQSPSNGSADASSLVGEVKRLGALAKGYGTGGTGPDYYDCSGLVWRACRNLSLYNGTRFTTYTFIQSTRSGWAHVVNTPQSGDIVIWTGTIPRHMGVVDGPDTFYSALSLRSGIKDTHISSHGGSAQYYRPGIAANSATPGNVR